MKGKLIGCDACQRTCPLQPDRQESAKDQVLVDDFVTSDDALFKEAIHRLGDQIGRNAARPQRVRAQAALLAGNRKHPKDIPVLREWAASEFDAVRIHAQWALNQIECSIQGLDQSCEKR